MHTVLIAETDDHALRARGDELLLDGYRVLTARSASEARAKLDDAAADAVVLGHLETPIASLVLLRDLRQGEIPRVDPLLPAVTVGADSEHVALRHYDAGADVALPSTASSLLVGGALSAVLARAGAERRRMLRVGPITVDAEARVAAVDGQPLHLTRLEFDLLRALAHRPNTVLSRRQLAKEIWDTEYVLGRTIDSHATRLRLKLGPAAGQLQTVRGVGYRLGR